jgi:dipeptidyl aminopeptidase/acylaminoacyl peptidase
MTKMKQTLSMAIAAALLVGAVLPAEAAPREEVVRFEVNGQSVVGTLTLPESGEPAPVVLMLFGFLGHRGEWAIEGTEEGPYSRAARLWADRGIASLRIDYRGSGESEGNFADATVSSEAADGIGAIQFIKADPRLDADRLAVLGWSLGGPVATVVAATGQPDALVLWNGVSDPVATFTGMLGSEVMTAAPEGAPVDVTMPWGQPISLGRPMIAELRALDPAAELAGYAGPLLVAQGSRDVVVGSDGVGRLTDAHAGDEVVWTAEMDHVFNIETGPETVDALIAATADFLESRLR